MKGLKANKNTQFFEFVFDRIVIDREQVVIERTLFSYDELASDDEEPRIYVSTTTYDVEGNELKYTNSDGDFEVNGQPVSPSEFNYELN